MNSTAIFVLCALVFIHKNGKIHPHSRQELIFALPWALLPIGNTCVDKEVKEKILFCHDTKQGSFSLPYLSGVI